jgi:hypothetical protein
MVCGIAGSIIGADIGGNFTTNQAACQTIQGVETCKEFHSFMYRGLPGYEGTGLLGLHLGARVGFVAEILLWKKRSDGKVA